MKWRLTVQFLLSVLSIAIIVIFVNTAIFIGLIVYQQTTNFQSPEITNNEQFARDFGQYIHLQNGEVFFDDKGLQLLREQKAWIQVLNQNGDMIGGHNVPDNALAHYSPIDLIQTYKYREIDPTTTVYVGGQDELSYLIGIQNSNVTRVVWHLSTSSFLQLLGKFGLAIIIADLLVTALVGWFFGRALTKPLYALIEQIQHLKNRKHTQVKTPKGLYKPVISNLNEVSSELAAHEMERKRLEVMREEWISNVSHDMKTPLASIRGYAELLRDGNLSEDEQEEYACIIEKQSLHMQNLLDDLNLTMRLRHKQLPLQLSNINIVQFTREIVIDTLNMPQYEHANIEFDASADSITHCIDAHFMRRAIVNFLYNSLLHNAQDVEVKVHVDTNSIIISDNGNGIAADDLEHIFERYYRGTNTAHTLGTGLGTAIARDIIEAHGGSVSITSKENEGTTVSIHLTTKQRES
ncbi:histidine kinase [Lysinibacillus contaminans]|uniref:histidine kinase n=1 Tax=Lysinibacillus contaminans TaxID=1293441 RepID=A0ABR5JVR1_9BACI|nr:HAMP domain-containing sensor histidine kinase [Lysinibacillus contaminans]KOS66212.1 histidine kinase [Lysinibacillus contaminans]